MLQDSYRCPSENRAVVNFVCCQEGCTCYPLFCGNKGCSCTIPHQQHTFKPLKGLLEELASLRVVPQQVIGEQQEVDGLLLRMIQDLTALRQQHSLLIRNHSKGYTTYAGLYKKLLSKQPLGTSEATGHAFSKLFEQSKQIPKMRAPYTVTDMQLLVELGRIETAAATIRASLQKLWKASVLNQSVTQFGYTFWKDARETEVEVLDSGIRAKVTSGWKLVQLQPRASNSRPSKVVVQLTSFAKYVAVGLCLKQVINQGARLSYESDNQNHGTYVMFNTGQAYSHCGKPEKGLVFKPGDSIQLEFSPTTGTLTYMLLGVSPKKVAQKFNKEHLQQGPVHFCIAMGAGCEARIL